MPSAEVPGSLRAAPFRLADALAEGLSRRQLDSAAWRKVAHDVYVHADLEDNAALRLRVAAMVMPADAVFSGETAAWLHGVDVRLRRGRPLEITAPRGCTFSGRGGLLVPRQAQFDQGDVTTVGGLRVTTPLRTAFDLVRLRPRLEAVVALDALLHQGLLDPDELIRYSAAHPGWRGVARLPGIVALSDGRSESPMESRTRVLLVDARFGRLEVQYVVRDENGVFVARLDFAYPDHRIGIDYDGAVHERAEVRIRDARRRNRLLGVSWIPLTFTSEDYYRGGGVRILTDVRAAVADSRRAHAG